MIIQHNIPAINSHRQLGINNAATAKNLEKLSSGYRINRAGDDAAGLAISEKMRGQIRGLAMAEQNCENGISLIQTAEGGLNETHAILQRMRELAVQASNGTYDDEVDRANINKEVEALKSEIDRISSSTHYNGINLLDGSMGAKKMSQITVAADKESTLGKVGIGKDVALTTIDTSVAGETATMVINRNDTGDISSITLQIGDKTYIGVDDNGTYKFMEGNTTLAAVAIGTLDPGTTDNVIDKTDLALKNTSTTVAGITLSTTNLIAQGDVQVGSKDTELVFQIGANGTADQQVGLNVANMSTGNLGSKVASQYNATGLIAGISLATRDEANDAIKVITAATNQVSGTRADLGALQNRLEHTLNNLGVTKENLTAAESTIRDVDMAKEMMEFTKNNILVQASQAMLAQANQLPQGVLQLLR